MADISDVTAYLATVATSAVYPNGTSSPSVGNLDVRIYEGWPLPDQLDLDVGGFMLSGNPPVKVPRPGGPAANVSVYPMPGTATAPFQILDNTYTIVNPNFGMVVAPLGTVPLGSVGGQGTPVVITVSGQPVTGEYLTVVCDRTFIYSATGASTAAVLASLASQAAANYFGVSSTATTLTIPANFSVSVRQGSVGTLAKVTHRQCHAVMVSTWAPTHVARQAIAAAIDVLVKQNIRVVLADTSSAKITYMRTTLSDEQELQTIYRRDLIYEVEYATLFQFPGYVITSSTINLQGGNWQLSDNSIGAAPPTTPALV